MIVFTVVYTTLSVAMFELTPSNIVHASCYYCLYNTVLVVMFELWTYTFLIWIMIVFNIVYTTLSVAMFELCSYYKQDFMLFGNSWQECCNPFTVSKSQESSVLATYKLQLTLLACLRLKHADAFILSLSWSLTLITCKHQLF